MKTKIFLILLNLLLLVAWYRSCDNRNVESVEPITPEVLIDTFYVYHTDTMLVVEPKYITEYAIDTIYINDTLFLPITQRYYSKNNVYDIWISGYNANLDSVKTYNNTVYKTVTLEVPSLVKDENFDFYFFGGLNSLHGAFYPQVGISMVTPKKVQYKANLGTNQGGLIYGLEIGFKL